MECLQKKEPLYIGLNNNMDTMLCLTKNEFNIRENSEPVIYNSLNIWNESLIYLKPVDNIKDIESNIKLLKDYIFIFGQPDIFVMKNVTIKRPINNKRDFDIYIENLKHNIHRLINEHYCKPNNIRIGVKSNHMLSSIEFCSICKLLKLKF